MSVRSSAKKMAVVAQHNYYNFDFTVREVVLMGRAPHKKTLERDNAKIPDRDEALKPYRWRRCRPYLFHSFRRRAAEGDPGKSTCPADLCTDSG